MFFDRSPLLSLSLVGLMLSFWFAGSAQALECRSGASARVWTLPLRPKAGELLEVVAVATDGALDRLRITDPSGRKLKLSARSAGGPPWSLRGTLYGPASGRFRIEAMRGRKAAACTEIQVSGGRSKRGSGEWGIAEEALFAVWVEHLFDAPLSESLSFDSLQSVLRDPRRNFLYNYLGADEDRRLWSEPDCADLPYILRAYFAWKMDLSVAYRACSRGGRGRPPRCQAPSIETAAAPSGKAFREQSLRIMNRVHSGNGRTALGDERTDFYPVALTREALWPGTVFADPYGHVLVLTKWLPQAKGKNGVLLAVDAQPDNSVRRKRFWEGTFLFADTPTAGPGFKAFRPLTRSGGKLRYLSSDALRRGAGRTPLSTEQAGMAPETFYARMERLINPKGLDPVAAYESTLAALMEQLGSRVKSVQNGEDHMRRSGGKVMAMPKGPAIFETTGPWEDYATPSRDMRLLIAMKVLEGLPDRIRRHPGNYLLGRKSAERAARDIEKLHRRRATKESIRYLRSDGSSWELTLADVLARRTNLEMAYNPNDCMETRWGAAAGSREAATCKRRAPASQRARMREYRPWFRDTRRPPR